MQQKCCVYACLWQVESCKGWKKNVVFMLAFSKLKAARVAADRNVVFMLVFGKLKAARFGTEMSRLCLR